MNKVCYKNVVPSYHCNVFHSLITEPFLSEKNHRLYLNIMISLDKLKVVSQL
jgi:hypothetical protein